MSYSITTIEEIDEDDVAPKSVGISDTEKLRRLPQPGAQALAARSKLDPKKLLRWANMADKLRIKGMGNDYAGLLREAGVDTVKELISQSARRPIHAGINKKRKLVSASTCREAGDALGRAGPKAPEKNHLLSGVHCRANHRRAA